MENFIKQNWAKVIAAILLFWALANHPYGYYQLLRWIVAIVGIYCALNEYNIKKQGTVWMWIFIAIAVLFNPIAPVTMQKDTWQLIDVVVGALFIISTVSGSHDHENQSKKPE